MLLDLSYRLTAQTEPFPGDPLFKSEQVLSQEDGGFNVHAVRFSTHWGTHLDAPAHVDRLSDSIADIQLNKLYGSCICIKLYPESNIQPDTKITLEQLTSFDSLFNNQNRVVFQTGWSRYWGTADYFAHSPGFSLEALQYLSEKRLDLIGFDLPSPIRDPNELTGHQLLLNKEIVIVENLTNLDHLPPTPTKFTISAFPLAIEDMDGFPVRVVAITS